MSRIPPPRGVPRPVLKTVDSENKAAKTVFKKPAVGISTRTATKRPGESQATLSEKRPRTAVGKSTGENENAVTRNAGFSERAKRAALKPIAETVMVRGSLPVLGVSSKRAKRPAWDLKGRIQDMEEHFAEAKTQNSTLNERILALEAANKALHDDARVKATMSEEACGRVATLEALIREKSEESESTIREKDRTIAQLREKNESLERELSTLKSEHDTLKSTYQQETTVLRSSITALTCSKSGLQTRLDATEHLCDQLREEVRELREQKSGTERECERLRGRVGHLEEKLLEGEGVRRKLHNTIQELKGNIRVFCRIRPALPEELKNNIQLADITLPSPKTIEIQQIPELGINEAKRKFECSFDAVFGADVSQEEIFREISQLVQSAIDGYNVCVFAYGQTGSGKTYTMEGDPEHPEQVGMIPRSVRHVFACIAQLEPRGWKYCVEALFLEIYNERIQDLLHPESGRCDIIKSAGKGSDCLLSNVEASPVTSAEQVLELLKRARIHRAVAATKCNEYSSRSHYVFQLKAFGENHVTGEKCEGTLNLVDLAGSERVKESGSAGDRLTEAKAINKSLSNLGKVITALSRKDNHIPYRDSKLTHLLANSLGGNSKTLMFVNVSPDNSNLGETLNSLRFATKVNQCNIGTAQKRVK